MINPKIHIGFSKFFSRRPKWVVTATNSCMNVYVCAIHQNVKLMTHAVPSNDTYKNLLEKLVCDIDSCVCMMKQCNKCPGIMKLRDYLTEVFHNDDDRDEVIVSYKYRSKSGFISLTDRHAPCNEFIEKIILKIDDLTRHHYTAHSQATYLRKLKEDLPLNEINLLLDFAENYSFVCQDSVQGFHWNNNQATVHPFIFYENDINGSLTCSLCIISNERNHGANTVHTFITKIIEHVKQIIPNLVKIHYFR